LLTFFFLNIHLDTQYSFYIISIDGVYAVNCLEQFQRIAMDGAYAENHA